MGDIRRCIVEFPNRKCPHPQKKNPKIHTSIFPKKNIDYLQMRKTRQLLMHHIIHVYDEYINIIM